MIFRPDSRRYDYHQFGFEWPWDHLGQCSFPIFDRLLKTRKQMRAIFSCLNDNINVKIVFNSFNFVQSIKIILKNLINSKKPHTPGLSKIVNGLKQQIIDVGFPYSLYFLQRYQARECADQLNNQQSYTHRLWLGRLHSGKLLHNLWW